MLSPLGAGGFDSPKHVRMGKEQGLLDTAIIRIEMGQVHIKSHSRKSTSIF